MGRVGACGDNAAMESFFALLQNNVLDRHRWASREQLRLAIIGGSALGAPRGMRRANPIYEDAIACAVMLA